MSEWILINEIPSLDLSQISDSCCALMRDVAEIQFRHLIIKIHSLTGFCLNISYTLQMLSLLISELSITNQWFHWDLHVTCWYCLQSIIDTQIAINMTDKCLHIVWISKLESNKSTTVIVAPLYICKQRCDQIIHWLESLAYPPMFF